MRSNFLRTFTEHLKNVARKDLDVKTNAWLLAPTAAVGGAYAYGKLESSLEEAYTNLMNKLDAEDLFMGEGQTDTQQTGASVDPRILSTIQARQNKR